jgi:hypothetical protein
MPFNFTSTHYLFPSYYFGFLSIRNTPFSAAFIPSHIKFATQKKRKTGSWYNILAPLSRAETVKWCWHIISTIIWIASLFTRPLISLKRRPTHMRSIINHIHASNPHPLLLFKEYKQSYMVDIALFICNLSS